LDKKARTYEPALTLGAYLSRSSLPLGTF